MVFALLLGLSPALLQSQEEEGESPPREEENAPLPRSFRDFSLGMGLEELKEALKGDGLFLFRGDRDVSFLPHREENLVESAGSSFIRRAYFQFREGSLFVMSFTLNTALIDYHSVVRSLVEKYGEPGTLNPQEAVWESDTLRLSLERPLTVKYLDLGTFTEILDESAARESGILRRREDFLREF
jgi:hypothetical protein